MRYRLLLPLLFGTVFAAEAPQPPCTDCVVWNAPQQPFRVFGNTWFVGTHGLSAILITSPAGHILIDGALEESVPHIVSNIRSLGFRIEDVKLIVNSHVHFDHAGGIAELEKLSGARVVASRWAADVMRKGTVPRDDPQFGLIRPIARVARVETLRDGETLTAGSVSITAHLTPGHTPGGTSWTWRSCENLRCLNLVYADSLTPVSAEGFLFTSSRQYPNAIADFERSYAFLESVSCDLLLTPHPDAAGLWERLESRKTKPDSLIDPAACRLLAAGGRERLKKRIAIEQHH